MADVREHTERYLRLFEEFDRSLNGESRSPLHRVRRRAIARFAELGFPTIHDEEWRFTNISSMVQIPFSPVLRQDRGQAALPDISEFTFSNLQCIRLVFIDGLFRMDLSVLPQPTEGLRIESLASAVERDGSFDQEFNEHAPAGEPFTALNMAFLQDGALIRIPDELNLETPIHLLYMASSRPAPFLMSPRNFIVTGNKSRVSIIETYAGFQENVYLTNAVSEIFAGEESVVEHDKLQRESEKGYHVGGIHVHQRRGSRFASNSIALGGAIARNTITVALEGEQCECTLNGLALGTGSQVLDNHTMIDHAQPRCESHELYKSVLDGRAKGVFNGKILVRKDAQKTDAKQTNKTLLLSDEATIDTKPQLEIFADDVKCTHGATVGQLDQEQIFYLRSRGISLVDARDVLTFAFAADIVEKVHCEPLRLQLEGMLRTRLRHGRVRHHGID